VLVKYSDRLNKLSPYLFVEIDKKKKAAIDKGVDVISMGVGDPDSPTPKHIVKVAQKAMEVPKNQKYPFGKGLLNFRRAVSGWYKSRFSVDLDPATEITSVIGTKEGIGHISQAFVNPGEAVLVPEPGYPVYNSGTIFSEGETCFLPLLEKNGFLPDLENISRDTLKRAKLLFINYPNNPTSAIAKEDFFKRAIEFANKNNIIIAHDAAYSEIYFDEPPISFLSVDGAKEVGVEFHSCSKTYNMTGWRIGWLAGKREIINGLVKVKDNYDSGAFQVVQEAAVAALTGPQKCVDDMRKLYKDRMKTLVNGLKALGWDVKEPKATFYVWAHVPKGYTSIQAVGKLLDEAGVIVTPGNGLGPSGEGYVRFALTVPTKRIEEVLSRIKNIKW